MVEGGTLLRCYTSQRGIEGSNPSSSAPKVPRFRSNAKAKKGTGFAPGPYYTNEYTNAAKTPSLVATNAAFVILYLYPRPPEVVVTFAVQPGLVQPKSSFLPDPMQDAGYALLRIILPRTWVYSG